MAPITFSIKTMPFAANLQVADEWTQVSYADLAAAAQITAGDYSEIFYAILAIIFGANNGKYADVDELFSEIFSVRSAETGSYRRLVEDIYGGRIKKKDGELVLVFGNRQFPITQDGENLICGNVTGRLMSTSKTDANNNQYYVLEWHPKASYEDKNFRYIIPVAIAKVNDKMPVMDLDRLDDIAAKNNLIDWVESVGSGGNILKAYQLFEGTGVQSFKVVAVSVTPSNKEGYKDNVLFTLEDGRKVNANSNAQSYFIGLSEAERKLAVPCLWIVNKYEEKKCSSNIESLGAKIGSTNVPLFGSFKPVEVKAISASPIKSAAPSDEFDDGIPF